MPGLAEIATIMLTGAQHRIDATARNISNMNTPGFRSERVFSVLLDQVEGLPVDRSGVLRDSNSAPLMQTGNPLDIAASGGTVLLMRGANGYYVTRTAAMRRDAEGRLVDGRGGVLQSVGGGDVTIDPGAVQILADGTVLVDGAAQGRIGLLDAPPAGTAASAHSPTTLVAASNLGPASGLHQGALVPSNVDLGQEMVELTKAGKQAEAAARLFQIYDDLLGRAATKFGEMNG